MNFLAPFIEKAIISPIEFLAPLSNISWPHMCGFISRFSVFFTIVLWCGLESGSVVPLDLSSGLFYVGRSLGEAPCSCEKCHGDVDRVALRLWVALCSVAILTIFILPIREHGTSFHLCRLQFLSSSSCFHHADLSPRWLSLFLFYFWCYWEWDHFLFRMFHWYRHTLTSMCWFCILKLNSLISSMYKIISCTNHDNFTSSFQSGCRRALAGTPVLRVNGSGVSAPVLFLILRV